MRAWNAGDPTRVPVPVRPHAPCYALQYVCVYVMCKRVAGTVLQIPLSILADFVLYGTTLTLVQLGGCALIVGGFAAQVWADFQGKQRKKQKLQLLLLLQAQARFVVSVRFGSARFCSWLRVRR